MMSIRPWRKPPGDKASRWHESCVRASVACLRKRAGLSKRIAAVLNLARFAGPTGDIDQILAEIERGPGVSQ